MEKNVIGLLVLPLAATLLCGMSSVPSDVTVRDLADGRREIVKVYELAADEDPSELIEQPFAQDGYAYEYQSMTQAAEHTKEVKYAEAVHQMETEEDDMETVLAALPGSLSYAGGDGFEGELILRPDTVKTEVKEWKTSSYTVSDTKTYTGLAYNDPSLVPKTVTKNGMTLSLTGVTWTGVSGSGESGSLIPSSYTATAQYAATATNRYADGYLTTAQYGGEVVRELDGPVTYTVVYSGVEIDPEPENILTPLDIVTLAFIGLAALGCIGTLCVLIRQSRRLKRQAAQVREISPAALPQPQSTGMEDPNENETKEP